MIASLRRRSRSHMNKLWIHLIIRLFVKSCSSLWSEVFSSPDDLERSWDLLRSRVRIKDLSQERVLKLSHCWCITKYACQWVHCNLIVCSNWILLSWITTKIFSLKFPRFPHRPTIYSHLKSLALSHQLRNQFIQIPLFSCFHLILSQLSLTSSQAAISQICPLRSGVEDKLTPPSP